MFIKKETTCKKGSILKEERLLLQSRGCFSKGATFKTKLCWRENCLFAVEESQLKREGFIRKNKTTSLNHRLLR